MYYVVNCSFLHLFAKINMIQLTTNNKFIVWQVYIYNLFSKSFFIDPLKRHLHNKCVQSFRHAYPCVILEAIKCKWIDVSACWTNKGCACWALERLFYCIIECLMQGHNDTQGCFNWSIMQHGLENNKVNCVLMYSLHTWNIDFSGISLFIRSK